MSSTIVLQSHRDPLPHSWLKPCLSSVRQWAEFKHYDYLFIGDELFDPVDDEILSKTSSQPVIASDLGRLYQLQNLLKQGYQTVIWCDADFLIFAPEHFAIPESDYALGREVWIQAGNSGQLKSYRKVHNAFLMFRQGNSFLDFYTETAEKLLLESTGSVPPQFIGPKLLTALHNIALCPVMETAGMLSPVVLVDIINEGGHALKLFKSKSTVPISGANLCCSSIENKEISKQDIINAMRKLLDENRKLFC